MMPDYNYYKTVFSGKLIPGEAFCGCSRKAKTYMDKFTYGRTRDESRVNEDCICDMAEEIYRAENREKEKKSESIDGYSVTYVVESSDGEDPRCVLEQKLHGIASLYLEASGLMYSGVYVNEH